MKKQIILSVLLFVVTCIYAQTQSSDHLTFKGVPIDGKLNEFVSKMKQNGFAMFSTENGITLLTGDFAGYKDCIIGVTTLQDKDLVSKISVVFSKKDSWSMLSSNYFSLKEMLTQKYGEPSECVEKFQSSYELKDDNSKMHAVKMDRCEYFTTYETEKGNIQLTIKQSDMNCFVVLSYFDKINGEIVKSKAIDDL